MKDPTGNAAARNVDGLRRDAVLQYPEPDGKATVWLDMFTLRTLRGVTVVFTDLAGIRHIRFNEKTLALLEQGEGQAPKKGNQS